MYILSYTDTTNKRKGFDMKATLELYGPPIQHDKPIKKANPNPKPILIDETNVKPKQITPYIEKGGNKLNLLA